MPGLPRWFGPGAEGNLRLCFSTSHAIVREAMDRIEAALVSLTRRRDAAPRPGSAQE